MPWCDRKVAKSVRSTFETTVGVLDSAVPSVVDDGRGMSSGEGCKREISSSSGK
jgi:hypothetical protein